MVLDGIQQESGRGETNLTSTNPYICLLVFSTNGKKVATINPAPSKCRSSHISNRCQDAVHGLIRRIDVVPHPTPGFRVSLALQQYGFASLHVKRAPNGVQVLSGQSQRLCLCSQLLEVAPRRLGMLSGN